MRKGFTLLELIIVIIILGILASLALPRLTNFASRSRAAEALNMFGSLRSSLERFHLEQGAFDGSVGNAAVLGGAGHNLDLDAPVSTNFGYALAVTGPNTYTITASCIAAGCAATDTIVIDRAGLLTKNGIFQ